MTARDKRNNAAGYILMGLVVAVILAAIGIGWLVGSLIATALHALRLA